MPETRTTPTPPVSAAPLGRPLVAIGVLLAALLGQSLLDASGKWVMAAGVPLLALSWVRYLVHLSLGLALVVPSHGWRALKARNPRGQLLRGIATLAATLLFFSAVARVPLAEATAINFLAPLIMLAAAPWVLGEAPRKSRWIAAGLAFVGMLIVVRPGGGLDPLGTLYGLGTACCVAIAQIVTRHLAQENPLTTLVWTGIIGTAATTVGMFIAWPTMWAALSTLSPLTWLLLLSTGIWGGLGHLFQIRAFRLAPASLLAPFMYLQIVYATTLGWLIWGDFPKPITWVGIAIICVSGAGIAAVEWHRNRPAAKARGV